MIRIKHISFAILAALVLFAAPVTQAQKANRAKLLGLSVEGNKSVDENLIKLSSGLTEGTSITGEDIQAAIKQLWDLGMFSDIQVLLDRQIGNSIYLTLKVEEYPH
ncbi:MAG: hypothetical protein D6814_00270, partial [Calditrichaeota bacterium]